MQLFDDTREIMHYTEFAISQILRIIRCTYRFHKIYRKDDIYATFEIYITYEIYARHEISAIYEFVVIIIRHKNDSDTKRIIIENISVTVGDKVSLERERVLTR